MSQAYLPPRRAPSSPMCPQPQPPPSNDSAMQWPSCSANEPRPIRHRLVGTRSPYGAVRNSRYPHLVAGGSCSGSAVAVALGIADIGIGTDTAGSVRVPAALNGIVGIKPTLALIPAHAVVPACASYDAVSVLAADLTLATARRRDGQPRCPRPPQPHLACQRSPRSTQRATAGYPRSRQPHRTQRCLPRRILADRGLATDAVLSVEPVYISALLNAVLLLYDGAIVAERYAASANSSTAHPQAPTPRGVNYHCAREISGPAFAADLNALAHARADAADLLDAFDALLLPTTTEHPTLSEVHADPFSIYRRLRTYTYFCYLLDMAAVAVPVVPTSTRTPFVVLLVVPAFYDHIAADIAARLISSPSALFTRNGFDFAVFAPTYAVYPCTGYSNYSALATSTRSTLSSLIFSSPSIPLPPHPLFSDVARTGSSRPVHCSDLRSRPARFLASLPTPMSLTIIELENGRTVIGLTAIHDATDITTTEVGRNG